MAVRLSPSIATAIVAAVTVLLGLLGLFYPESVMNLLGFAIAPTRSLAGVHGEVRATFGGIFTIAGAYLAWTALDPGRNRQVIFFASLLWLGACGGRLFAVFVDGNPGFFGWFSIVFEGTMGGLLIYASQGAATMPAAEAEPFGT
jgi:hypothetical protein